MDFNKLACSNQSVVLEEENEDIQRNEQMQKLLAQDLNDEDFKFTNETLQPTTSVVIPDFKSIDVTDASFSFDDVNLSYDPSVFHNQIIASKRKITDAEIWQQQQNYVDATNPNENFYIPNDYNKSQKEVRFSLRDSNSSEVSPSNSFTNSQQVSNATFSKSQRNIKIAEELSELPAYEDEEYDKPESEKDLNEEQIQVKYKKQSSTKNNVIQVDHGPMYEQAQLAILYEARGKQIDRLKSQITQMQDKWDKERRIAQHQIYVLTENEKETNNKVKLLDKLVAKKEEKIKEVDEKYQQLIVDFDNEKSSKVEVEKELSGCRCSVEHLQQQLIHLQRSDTLERARQSNDEILAAMEDKYNKQLYLLKEQLQNSEESSRNKEKECKDLRDRLTCSVKQTEITVIEKSRIINQLSQNLQQAQHQVQSLLASGGEIAYLKQVNGKLQNENENLHLKTEKYKMNIRNLEEEISQFEVYIQSSVVSGKNASVAIGDNNNFNESITDYMLQTKKMDVSDAETDHTLLNKLRVQLQKSLASNKEKRDQASKLEGELEKSREECKKLKQQISNNSTKSVITEETQTENNSLDHQESEKVRELTEKQEKLTQCLKDAKQQLFRTIEVHDQDKEEALQRRETSLNQLFDEKQLEITNKLNEEYSEKLKILEVEKDEIIFDEKKKYMQVTTELIEVKNQYVEVCNELKNIDSKLNIQYKKELEQIKKSHSKAMDDIEDKLEEQRNNSKTDLQKLIESKISIEREKWNRKSIESQNSMLKKAKFEFENAYITKIKQLEIEHKDKVEEVIKREKENWEKNNQIWIKKSINEMKSSLKQQYLSKLQRIQQSVQTTEEEIDNKWKNKLQEMEDHYKEQIQVQNVKCENYEEKIKSLNSSMKVERNNEDKLKKLQEKHTQDIKVLKTRIAGEYSRWKKEKSELNNEIDKLKSLKQQVNMDKSKEVCDELSKLYLNSLNTIKDEFSKWNDRNRTETVKFLDENIN